MMHGVGVLLAVLLNLEGVARTHGSELIFYLSGLGEECFHQEVKSGELLTLNYYVLRGGDYRVDVRLEGPDGNALYERIREAFDSVVVPAADPGVHRVCFSSPRSFSQAKCVSVELDVSKPRYQLGAGAELPAQPDHVAGISQRLRGIQDALMEVTTTQTLLRHRASADWARASEVNSRVQNWSALQASFIVAVSAVQLFVLRKLFDERKPTRQKRAC